MTAAQQSHDQLNEDINVLDLVGADNIVLDVANIDRVQSDYMGIDPGDYFSITLAFGGMHKAGFVAPIDAGSEEAVKFEFAIEKALLKFKTDSRADLGG